MLITVIYQEKKNRYEREGNLVPKKMCACLCCLVRPSLLEGGRQDMSPAGARGALNNSQVSDTQKNYTCLTYEGINPTSLLMAKRCVFKCHKNLAFFSS